MQCSYRRQTVVPRSGERSYDSVVYLTGFQADGR